jgi:predicted ATP-grasp superfamily ATP-dependent carboligase
MAKTNKFTKNISQNSSVLTDRAVIVAGQAKRAQEDLVRSIEGRIDDMKMNIIKMTDISPDNTQSLKPTGQVVENPKQWVEDLHKTKVELALAEAELKIANETLSEWFSEAEEDVKL